MSSKNPEQGGVTRRTPAGHLQERSAALDNNQDHLAIARYASERTHVSPRVMSMLEYIYFIEYYASVHDSAGFPEY